MRYKDKLEFEINVDPSINSVHIVKLVLQPIVENALIHAFDNSGEGNVITVTCKKNKGHMKIPCMTMAVVFSMKALTNLRE